MTIKCSAQILAHLGVLLTGCFIHSMALAENTSALTKPVRSIQQVPFSQVLALPQQAANTRISYGDSEFQFVEGWVKQNNNKGSIVFVHGGCWLSEYSLEHARGLMTSIFELGYNVWSVEYRRTGTSGGGWPVSLHDIEQALTVLNQNQHITLDETVLMGHSAGGHLALLAGAKFPQLRTIAGLAPIYDFAKYAQGSNSCQKAAVAFIGDNIALAGENYENANPAVSTLHKQSLIFAGGEDGIVPGSQFTQVDNAQLTVIDEAGHFDFIHPDSTAWRTVLATIIK